jgi:hypothetical protein
MQKWKDVQVWIGFVDGKPSFYEYPDYYDGVPHGDMFKSKRAAKRCYQDVRACVLKIPDEE